MHARDATGARPRCGTCIGSSAGQNRRHNNRNPSCGKGSWRWKAVMPRRPGAPKRRRGTRPGCSLRIVTRRRPGTSIPPAGRSRRLPQGTCRGRAGGCATAQAGPGSPQAGLACALRSIVAGLERAHRTRPANRGAVILRQGLHRHDPAHPGAGGEPGYRGRDTGADDRGIRKIPTGSLGAEARRGLS